jgi:hypothetical protein
MHNEDQPKPEFIGLIQRPVVADGRITLTVPTHSENIEPVATYVVLSEIERTDAGNYEIERRYRLWEVYQMGWTREIRLPNTSEALNPAKSYRWEVLFMGRNKSHTGSGEYFLDEITHVSRNAFDL